LRALETIERPLKFNWLNKKGGLCQPRLKIPNCAGRKFPTPEAHGLGRSGVSAVFLARLVIRDFLARCGRGPQ